MFGIRTSTRLCQVCWLSPAWSSQLAYQQTSLASSTCQRSGSCAPLPFQVAAAFKLTFVRLIFTPVNFALLRPPSCFRRLCRCCCQCYCAVSELNLQSSWLFSGKPASGHLQVGLSLVDCTARGKREHQRQLAQTTTMRQQPTHLSPSSVLSV